MYHPPPQKNLWNVTSFGAVPRKAGGGVEYCKRGLFERRSADGTRRLHQAAGLGRMLLAERHVQVSPPVNIGGANNAVELDLRGPRIVPEVPDLLLDSLVEVAKCSPEVCLHHVPSQNWWFGIPGKLPQDVQRKLDEGDAVPHRARGLTLLVARAVVVDVARVPHREVYQQRRVQAPQDPVPILRLAVRRLDAAEGDGDALEERQRLSSIAQVDKVYLSFTHRPTF
mmetsp:Transcript_42520/g.101201  ORF Transcript_42520/g.101201 Transcript_42520/m.101201 type:complete len:226 (-) Transcript_42520:335-1012(-)